ncbi:MAG: hypothetical protein WBA61_05980 [Aequorivita sp.]
MKKISGILILLILLGCADSKKGGSNNRTDFQESQNGTSFTIDFDSTKVSSYNIEESEIDSFKPMVKKLSKYETQELKDLPNYLRLTLSIVIPFDITKESLETTMILMKF